MSDDWLSTSATDLGKAIGRGEIDSVALTQAYLDAIDAHEYRDRIYSAVTPDRALAEAQAAATRAAQGTRRSLLDGVPISWKDMFDSAGTETAAGTALLAGRVPDADARVLRNASSAGLVCLGKTHMSELAFSGVGLNPVTATPPNSHDPALLPGGSSSGAAASVAFGLAAAGIGSDTGGSVRIPAAWNDLTGLKTTSGRVSLDGAVPLCLRFDTVGPLARSVADCAALLAVMEGRAAPSLTGATLKGRRIGVLQTSVYEDIRPEPLAAYQEAESKLAAAGAILEQVEAPELARIMPLAGILFTAEAYAIWRDQIEEAPEKMFPQILGRFRSGAAHSAADYIAAWHDVDRARVDWQARMARYDAVICPTAPNLPPDMHRMLTDHDYYVTENLLTLRNTRVANMMGLPALTLPTGRPSCGIMLMGRAMGEDALLRMGAAAEAALS